MMQHFYPSEFRPTLTLSMNVYWEVIPHHVHSTQSPSVFKQSVQFIICSVESCLCGICQTDTLIGKVSEEISEGETS